MKKTLITILIIMTVILSGCVKTSDIDKKISKMTIKDKVAQMIIPTFRYKTYEKVLDENGNETINKEDLEVLDRSVIALLDEYKFGGVILFAENLHSSAKAYAFIRQLKDAHGNDEIPLLIGVDQEGGNVKRLDFGTTMSGNMALCASNDPQNAYESSRLIGSELKMMGINLDFAPVVDINSNPANPIIGVRSFSDDPDYAKAYIESSIAGYHDEGILVSIKHFPGHGDTSTDSHTGLPLVEKSYAEIKNKELKAFEYGISAGADMIMSAHIQFPNIDDTKYKALDGNEVYLPATLSKKIISIIRDDLSFDGVICADSLSMDAIKAYFDPKDVAKLAINAGIDVLLMPVDYKQSLDTYISQLKDYVDMVVALVEKGDIDEKLIDASVRRILTLKEKIKEESDDTSNYTALIGSKESHEKELEIAKKCVTLVEKNNLELPLSRETKTLILAPYGSQGGAAGYAKQILLEKGLIDEESIDYYVFGGDDAESFDYQMIDDYDNVVLVSAMYGFEDICDDYSKIIDNVLKLCKEKDKKSILISSHLPYDLSRFEADAKIAVYLGAGVNEIPTDYNSDVKTYAPNLLAGFIHLFEEGSYSGRLPLDIPAINYDEATNTYSPSTEIRYHRGEGLDK